MPWAGDPAEPAARPRIVAAGALVPGKGYDILLEALGSLARSGAAFEVVLAGDGPERGGLVQLTDRLGLRDRVQFLGEVSDVPGLMAGGHVLAHPSLSEGLSNTLLEAMAEGLPVVTTSVGGNPEIIEDGRTGLIVPPRAVEAISLALGRLLADPSLRGADGRRPASNTFLSTVASRQSRTSTTASSAVCKNP